MPIVDAGGRFIELMWRLPQSSAGSQRQAHKKHAVFVSDEGGVFVDLTRELDRVGSYEVYISKVLGHSVRDAQFSLPTQSYPHELTIHSAGITKVQIAAVVTLGVLLGPCSLHAPQHLARHLGQHY